MKINTGYHISKHLEVALLISLSALFLTYLTLYYWKRNGFDDLEIGLIALLSSIYLLFTSIILNIWLQNKYRSTCILNHHKPFKKIYSFLIIICMTAVIVFLLDAIFYYFIDKSVPIAYAEKLEELMIRSHQSEEVIKAFYDFPLMIQNSVVVIGAILLSGIISLPFIRKDGKFLRHDYATNL